MLGVRDVALEGVPGKGVRNGLAVELRLAVAADLEALGRELLVLAERRRGVAAEADLDDGLALLVLLEVVPLGEHAAVVPRGVEVLGLQLAVLVRLQVDLGVAPVLVVVLAGLVGRVVEAVAEDRVLALLGDREAAAERLLAADHAVLVAAGLAAHLAGGVVVEVGVAVEGGGDGQRVLAGLEDEAGSEFEGIPLGGGVRGAARALDVLHLGIGGAVEAHARLDGLVVARAVLAQAGLAVQDSQGDAGAHEQVGRLGGDTHLVELGLVLALLGDAQLAGPHRICLVAREGLRDQILDVAQGEVLEGTEGNLHAIAPWRMLPRFLRKHTREVAKTCLAPCGLGLEWRSDRAMEGMAATCRRVSIRRP
ncbi:hypothetical protein D3C86_1350080 [compost metagenome]